MRAFIAIEISDAMRDELAQIQAHLKYAGADVKWVEPANIHLTLKFLGEVSEERVQEIAKILDEIGGRFSPFELCLGDLGAFPKIDYPRIIWVGLDKGAEEAKRLAEEIDVELSKIGFEKETRPFAGHLTLGRLRSPKNRALLVAKIKSFTNDERRATSDAAAVFLLKSTLTPTGAIYTKLHEAKLGWNRINNAQD